MKGLQIAVQLKIPYLPSWQHYLRPQYKKRDTDVAIMDRSKLHPVVAYQAVLQDLTGVQMGVVFLGNR